MRPRIIEHGTIDGADIIPYLDQFGLSRKAVLAPITQLVNIDQEHDFRVRHILTLGGQVRIYTPKGLGQALLGGPRPPEGSGESGAIVAHTVTECLAAVQRHMQTGNISIEGHIGIGLEDGIQSPLRIGIRVVGA
jgi:hypothetical protein